VRPPLPDFVEAWTLWQDRLQVVMREGHLLSRFDSLRFEQVLAFPVIGSNPAGALSQQLRQEAAVLGLSFAAEVTASNFSAACRLAEAGLGLSIMPAASIPAGMGAPLVRRSLAEAWAERPLKVYASTRSPRGIGAQALLQHLRRQAPFVSTLRQDGPCVLPAPGFEPQLAIAT
jgi:DNA-binding transcriptional LysR family regulator